jgi:hypothetical protein
MISSPTKSFFNLYLLADGAVPVFPATLKEAVAHHALAKQKKGGCQHDYKQESPNSERGWLWSCRRRCFHRNKPPFMKSSTHSVRGKPK